MAVVCETCGRPVASLLPSARSGASSFVEVGVGGRASPARRASGSPGGRCAPLPTCPSSEWSQLFQRHHRQEDVVRLRTGTSERGRAAGRWCPARTELAHGRLAARVVLRAGACAARRRAVGRRSRPGAAGTTALDSAGAALRPDSARRGFARRFGAAGRRCPSARGWTSSGAGRACPRLGGRARRRYGRLPARGERQDGGGTGGQLGSGMRSHSPLRPAISPDGDYRNRSTDTFGGLQDFPCDRVPDPAAIPEPARHRHRSGRCCAQCRAPVCRTCFSA